MNTAHTRRPAAYPADVDAIVAGTHGNPFVVLGMQGGLGEPVSVNVFVPEAAEVEVIDRQSGKAVGALVRVHPDGFFSAFIEGRTERFDYLLRLRSGDQSWDIEDPYRFPTVLGELDEYLLGEGRHHDQYEKLGAHPREMDGVAGVAFAVWAPNARRVSVVGPFNGWDGRRHPMRKRIGVGIWELFIPGLERGTVYKYEVIGAAGELLPLKADPMSFYQEVAPATASIVHGLPEHEWQDQAWFEGRAARQGLDAPVSIYEMHLGSWRTGGNGERLTYETIGDLLIPYLQKLGFTHVEMMPVTEHPFAGSWGYQPIGLFAPTSRFGTPDDFARLVDRLHQAGIGVIVDWVPAHFPSDAHGLVRFDGTALYEHEDPRLGFHQDWNTLIYNFGRNEVSNFLIASGLFWLERFHIDALRVDAVASMLYLDYSRNAGEWIPNVFGGNENLEAVEFIKTANVLAYERSPGIQMIAEESTAWPQVSRPVFNGGLGFGYKWNMGWMHDTLAYMQEDPINRRYHHHKMTFGIHYGYNENFVLPLSHDEVVHGKGSLINKMPGDRWQKFANLRAYYGFMWTHPGKKLLFMGGEFAQEREWNHDYSLDWHLLDDPMHAAVQRLIGDLNRLYRDHRALHELDCDPSGFEWIEHSDADNSVFLFVRRGRDGKPLVVACNMTPVVRHDYRFGVPQGGGWREILNTDAEIYGGSNVGNGGYLEASDEPSHGRPASLRLTLPPLATLVLVPDDGYDAAPKRTRFSVDDTPAVPEGADGDDATSRDPMVLASRYGISTRYKGLDANWHEVPSASVVAILKALGVDPDAEVLPEPVISPQSDPNRAIRSCYLPDWLEHGRAWGIAVQVYALRSERDWGIGDLTDLARFARMAGAAGADFVGTNPMHALFLGDPTMRSPFFPSNRRYLNPLYIAVDDVPGYVESKDEVETAHDLRRLDFVDYVGVTRLKLQALRRIKPLWEQAQNLPEGYGHEAFEAFRMDGGEALRLHALFEVLSIEMAEDGLGAGWKGWPSKFHSSQTVEVRAFAEAHEEDISFHIWLQWLTNVQLEAAQRAALESGMRVGLYLDFAVGEAPDGSATWSDPFVMMRGVDVGAPPDYFSTTGQNWGLAPISPRALVERRFEPYRQMVGATMQHSGALRIDHVMGIQQMFLIPEGHEASEGTYIHYPLKRMVEALAEMSHDHGALLIGEDLGNVPEGFRDVMGEASILSYRILYFEQYHGRFVAAEHYPRSALACLSTHDLPTLEGWWRGEDVLLRRQFGLIEDEPAAIQLEQRKDERQSLLRLLVETGLLTEAAATALEQAAHEGEALPPELVRAVHAFLARTPSMLVAVRIEDLAGERQPVNLPGTVDQYANWQRRLGASIDAIAGSPTFETITAMLAQERPRS